MGGNSFLSLSALVVSIETQDATQRYPSIHFVFHDQAPRKFVSTCGALPTPARSTSRDIHTHPSFLPSFPPAPIPCDWGGFQRASGMHGIYFGHGSRWGCRI